MAQVDIRLDIEEFLCASCNGYLSSAPVQVLSDGNSICGRCSLKNEVQPVFRNLTFEVIPRKISFPCRFANSGCTQQFLFDEASKHEAECDFRTFACPSVPKDACTWEGPKLQMLAHFSEQHLDSVKENAEFRFQLDQDKASVFIVVVNDVSVIFHFIYNAKVRKLLYDVRHMSTNACLTSCKMRVINDLEKDYCFMSKIYCFCYDCDFGDERYCSELFLNKLMDLLDNPKRVTVLIDVSLDKIEANLNTNKLLNVDYNLLNVVRCITCDYYLILPIFDCESGVVCADCKDINPKILLCTLFKNVQLNQRLTDVNYPCRWKNCNRVNKSDKIRRHETFCHFRIYKCFFKKCKEVFKFEEATDHLKNHGYEYFDNKFVYKMIVSEIVDYKTVFTLKSNEIICIKYRTVSSSNWKGPPTMEHKLHVYHVSGRNSGSVQVQFENTQSRIKYPPFKISCSRSFHGGLAPRGDYLSVTLSNVIVTPMDYKQ